MHLVWTLIKIFSWFSWLAHGIKMAVSPKYRRAVKKAKEEDESEEIYGTE